MPRKLMEIISSSKLGNFHMKAVRINLSPFLRKQKLPGDLPTLSVTVQLINFNFSDCLNFDEYHTSQTPAK
jgi:hypothetical protein